MRLRPRPTPSPGPRLLWLPSERVTPGDTQGLSLCPPLEPVREGVLSMDLDAAWIFPLSVTWAPLEPWRPMELQRVATRDFRTGYPMTWDLEVPMRKVSRPLLLKPGLVRLGPPPSELELQEGAQVPAPGPSAPGPSAPAGAEEYTDGAARWEESSPLTSAPSSPPPSSAPKVPKGSRMKGWSKSASWNEEDPWAKRR